MKKVIICFIITQIFITQSCTKAGEEAPAPVAPVALTKDQINQNKVLSSYATLAYALYSDVLASTQSLQLKLQAFVSSPSQQTLDEAKDAWIAAKIVYSQTESFRFLKDPDNPVKSVEDAINSWPLNEAYIDYVSTDETAGIINNTAFGAITKEKILGANQQGMKSNISCGYHAIEFLLWGHYTADDAGQRSFNDYVLTADSTHSNPKRRGEYLLAVADLLVSNLTTVADAWAPNTQNYRAGFIKNDSTALPDIINSMIDFGKNELAAKMSIALSSHMQKDAESCFSNQTHNDIYYGQLGIAQLYKGTYNTLVNLSFDLYSIEDFMVDIEEANLNTTMLTNYTATEDAAGGPILINEHFDQLISEGNAGNAQVQNLINALLAQSETLSSIALKVESLNL